MGNEETLFELKEKYRQQRDELLSILKLAVREIPQGHWVWVKKQITTEKSVLLDDIEKLIKRIDK